MRTHTAAAACLLLTTACTATATAEQPHYTVLNRASSTQPDHSQVASADLLMPGATSSQARKAIQDYAADLEGPAFAYLKVIRAEHADRYVCRARWYRDPTAFQQYGRGPQPTVWPAIDTNCPSVP